MAATVLINGATSTDATKVRFNLNKMDFKNNSMPALKSRGLGTGDSVRIWEYVNGGWQNTGVVLDETTTSRVIEAEGIYAVDIVMATAGPASCQLDSSRAR